MLNAKITSSQIAALPTGDSSILYTWLESADQGAKQPFALVRLLGKHTAAREKLMEAIHRELVEFAEQLKHTPGNVPRMFEKFIERMRATILEAVLEGTGIPLSDFHAVFGIVYDQHLLIAGSGKLTALFMHQTAQKRYTIYHLEDHFSDSAAPAWKDILQSVLDGELTAGDIFYLGTRTPANMLEASELQEVLVTLPIAGALKRIQQHMGAQTAFGAVAFKIKELGERGLKKQNPLVSMEQFGQTQKQTAQVLGDQVPDVQAAVKSISGKLSQSLSSAGKRDWQSSVKRVLLAGVFGGRALLLKIMPSKQAMRESKGAITGARASFVSTLVRGYYSITNLSPTQKLTAAGIMLTVVLMSGFLVINAKQSKKQESVRAAEIILDKIDEKVTAASATLTYENSDQAQLLLNEATALFGTLPETKKTADRITELKAEIAQVKLALRKVVQVTPMQEASIDATIHSVLPAGDGWMLIGNKLVQVDGAGAVTVTEEVPAATAATLNGTDTLLLAGTKLVRKTITGFSDVVSGLANIAPVAQIEAFNTSLYVLDPDNEQIVRMRPQGEQYEAGTNWIIDKTTSLAGAVDLAIDGNVYVLLPNGIAAFASGRETGFELGVVEPNLNGAQSIFTSVELTHLYVLDPANGRVVQIAKDGKLIAQFEAEGLASATAFYVKTDGTLFFTTPTGLYSFPTL
jgi:hypothetical protein